MKLPNIGFFMVYWEGSKAFYGTAKETFTNVHAIFECFPSDKMQQVRYLTMCIEDNCNNGVVALDNLKPCLRELGKLVNALKKIHFVGFEYSIDCDDFCDLSEMKEHTDLDRKFDVLVTPVERPNILSFKLFDGNISKQNIDNLLKYVNSWK